MKLKILLFVLTSLIMSNLGYSQIVVTNGDDDGMGSLRNAVAMANADPDMDEIIFDGDFTVSLTSGQIIVINDVTITGNGIGNTIIDGTNNGSNRLIGVVNASTFTIEGVTLQNATATINSSAIGIAEVTSSFITDCEFKNNATSDPVGAGAVGTRNTDIIISGCIFDNNQVTDAAASGGALGSSQNGTVTILNTVFTNNTASESGGAIEVISTGDVVISNCIFNDNTATGTLIGGGAFNIIGSANSSITGSQFMGNSSGGNGGAIYNQAGEMTIETSTIVMNQGANGAGVFNDATGILTIDRSTISNNTATGIGGGGIFNGGGSLDINASTIVQNTGTAGGGVFSSIAATFSNSIIALNTANAGINVSGNFSSNDYNIIGTDDLGVFPEAANDLEGVDPLIEPISDNGGITLTHRLAEDSPAYNAANPTYLENDQIDQSVFDGRRDIGAYESQTVLGITNFDGTFAQMLVYPNPAINTVTIALQNVQLEKATIFIYEVGTGRRVLYNEITDFESTINLNGLTTGTYLVNLVSDKGIQTQKLIIK